MSLNQTMNISLGSMKNNQYALTVVSQNIANLHVEGYQRQRVNFETNQYTTDCHDVLSTIKGMNGASISSLSDYVDEKAFDNLLNSNSDAQYYNTLADALGELEDIADDLGDNGLNSLLNDFYTAAVNLEQFPTDMSIRQQYILAAQNVCDKFNEISTKYNDLQEDKFNNLSNNVQNINTLLQELATLNKENAVQNGSPAIESQIDGILKELSNYMDIHTDKNSNGTYNFYVGNIKVVEGGEVKYKINAEFDSTNTDNAVQFSLQSTENPDYVITNKINESFNSGSMKAHLEFLNGSGGVFANVNDMKANLNAAASAFANALNDIQTYSNGDVFAASLTTAQDGSLNLEKSTKPMFTSTDGNALSAGNMTVNPEIVENPFFIATARIDLNNFKDENGNIDPTWVKAVGNSDNATEITALQHKKICSYGGGTNNCTLSEFLINNAAKNGLDAANIIEKADTYQDIADMNATNYANMVGVNLDEELADMLKYQRAFEASARIFSSVDELVSTIINMV